MEAGGAEGLRKQPKHQFQSAVFPSGYRNLSVAHHDSRTIEIKIHPAFGLALGAASKVYKRAYCKDFAAQCHAIATAAMDATRSFKSGCIEQKYGRVRFYRTILR